LNVSSGEFIQQSSCQPSYMPTSSTMNFKS